MAEPLPVQHYGSFAHDLGNPYKALFRRSEPRWSCYVRLTLLRRARPAIKLAYFRGLMLVNSKGRQT